jgi:hypothetical protein
MSSMALGFLKLSWVLGEAMLERGIWKRKI